LLKLPPYSKELYKKSKKGILPSNDINIWLGKDAWKKANSFAISMPDRLALLPPWDDPNIYFWPVMGCDVLLMDAGGSDNEYIEDLVYYLYRHNANKVRLITHDFNFIIFHKE
jgi:hypothetical protein